MNQVQIKITAPLRRFTGGSDVVPVCADTVGEALEALCLRHPELRPRVLDADGRPREFINVFVGRQLIGKLGGLAAPLSSGDVLSIASPFSGG